MIMYVHMILIINIIQRILFVLNSTCDKDKTPDNYDRSLKNKGTRGFVKILYCKQFKKIKLKLSTFYAFVT